jgi:microcystin-dependent protein
LFAVIGTAYGAADGTHFNVPDLRGRFLRGVDGGAGNDPDTLTRTASNTGGNTGDNVGSLQADAFQTHSHGIPFNQTAGATNVGGGQPPNDTGNTGAPASGNVSSETRPKNVYVNYIIKT